MRKRTAILIVSALLTASFATTSFAGTWQAQEDGQWKYQNDDGSYAIGWIEDGGKSYYLNEDGIMLANTTTPDGKQVDASGALVAPPLFDYDIEDCHATYLRHEIDSDYNGNPCVVVYYNYTNKKSDECSAMGNSCYIKAYQNGVECDRAIISSSKNNQATENYYKSVLPGTTIEVAEAFKLTDQSDITLILKDIFDWANTSPKITVTFPLK